MDITSVTVGLTVADVDRAGEWVERVFELDAPDVRPTDDVVEYQVGDVWLQLGAGATSGSDTAIRFGVVDLAAEHARLTGLGVAVGEIETVPGVLEYLEFRDPDGNLFSLYEMLEPPAA